MKQMMRVAAMAIAGMMALSAAAADASLREGARSFTPGDGVAYFSCVEILAYCVMSNHFHMLVYVPAPHALCEDEVLLRVQAFYARLKHAGEVTVTFDRLVCKQSEMLNKMKC